MVNHYTSFLKNDGLNLFSILSELGKLCKAIVGTKERLPDLVWSLERENGESFSICSIGTTVVRLSQFRLVVGKWIEIGEWLSNQLVCGLKFEIDLKQLDEVRDDSVGFAFGDGLAKDVNTLRRLEEIVTEKMVENVSKENTAEFQFAECAKYLDMVDQLLEVLFCLIEVTSGQPGRATEMAEARLSNSCRAMRSLYLIDGMVCLILTYYKSQSMVKKRKLMARFLPERIGKLVLMYSMYIRPIAKIACVGLKKRNEFDHWLFLHGGERMNDRKLSEVFRRRIVQDGGLRLTFRQYRHVAIGIAKKKLLLNWSEKEEEEEVNGGSIFVHLQSGHSVGVGRTMYAVSSDELRSLSEEVLEGFKKTSLKWHKLFEKEDVDSPKMVKDSNNEWKQFCSKNLKIG